MQMGTVAKKYGERTKPGRDTSPNSTNRPQISIYKKFLDNVQGVLLDVQQFLPVADGRGKGQLAATWATGGCRVLRSSGRAEGPLRALMETTLPGRPTIHNTNGTIISVRRM